MEGEKMVEMLVSRTGASSTSSRWNPTKEQISVLEELYREGLRTPSAEQIQQIASSLRAYGQLEGKNVFYWFQNHKARMRQKQKQEALFYMSRLIHSKPKVPILPAPPLCPSPPCPNVLCSPICIPESVGGFYTQLQKAVIPDGVSRIQKQNMTQRTVGHPHHYLHLIDAYEFQQGHEDIKHETLELFPLHPTGFLAENVKKSSFSSAVTN